MLTEAERLARSAAVGNGPNGRPPKLYQLPPGNHMGNFTDFERMTARAFAAAVERLRTQRALFMLYCPIMRTRAQRRALKRMFSLEQSNPPIIRRTWDGRLVS